MIVKKLNYINTDPINDTSGCTVYFMDSAYYKKYMNMSDKEIKYEFENPSFTYSEEVEIEDGNYIVFMYGNDEESDEDYDEDYEE